MPLGVHTSIAGGLWKSVERAVSLGCDAMQIFGRNPRAWAWSPVPDHEVALFRSKREEALLWPVAIHTTYLINLSAPDDVIFDKSVFLFKKEIETAERLGADYLVTHLGSPLERGPDFALKRILAALKETASAGLGKKTQVLLENTAGGGSGFGSSLTDIGRIIEGASAFGLHAGLCYDTCHGFAAGYDMRTRDDVESLVKGIDKEAGFKNLKLMHLNDSKGELNSRLDRHEHIGKGRIGIDGFSFLLNHPKVLKTPLILETPKKTEGDDPMNLAAIRKIKGEA
ncbi:MAG: deoxyribonuclease IV [Deltaproteobacteria bacterium]|nr:deoxyribonuclease IV [Deltaproteobacteria bacterium]